MARKLADGLRKIKEIVIDEDSPHTNMIVEPVGVAMDKRQIGEHENAGCWGPIN
jgi:hypothetical protein